MTIAEIEARVKEIDEQLAICDKATPGPWETGGGCVLQEAFPADIITEALHSSDLVDGDYQQGNIDFIAAAREGWPQALRNERAALFALLEVEFCYNCRNEGGDDHKRRRCGSY